MKFHKKGLAQPYIMCDNKISWTQEKILLIGALSQALRELNGNE